MEMERGEKRGFGESNKREESPSLEGEKSGDDGINGKGTKQDFIVALLFSVQKVGRRTSLQR